MRKLTIIFTICTILIGCSSVQNNKTVEDTAQSIHETEIEELHLTITQLESKIVYEQDLNSKLQNTTIDLSAKLEKIIFLQKRF